MRNPVSIPGEYRKEREERTSDSVRQRAIASIDEVRRPSVPMGVMKRWRLGVNRKGTASALTNSGLLGTIAGYDVAGQQGNSKTTPTTGLTRKHVRGVHLSARPRDMDAGGDTSAHTHHVRREDEGRHLERHLLPDVPKFARTLHRLDHVLEKEREARVSREPKAKASSAAYLLEQVVRNHLRPDFLGNILSTVPKFLAL